MLELWLSHTTSSNNLCGGPQKHMFGMNYNCLLRRNVSLGSLSHQLKSISTRGNMKLVLMTHVKLLKALRMISERKERQVSTFLLYYLILRLVKH